MSAASSAAPERGVGDRAKKARYRSAVLLGSFFSPKRRMNKNALWIPHQVGNGRSMTRESVCCHSGAPPGIRSPLRTKKEPPTIGEKEKPPLSGREGGSREREKGEDCVSAASSAAPVRGVGDRAKKPDTGRRFFLVRSSHRREE